MIRVSVVFLCLLAVAGCAIQRTDLSVVKEGATRAQVESALGKPIKSVETAEGRIDTYEYNRGYEPKPMTKADRDTLLAGGWILLPIIAPIAHSVRHEQQRAEIDLVYGPDDRVVGSRSEVAERQKRQSIKELAERGDAEAQRQYALYYATGQERIHYLCRAARRGDAESQYQLGRTLHPGDYGRGDYGRDDASDRSITPDPARAYMWFAVASNNGFWHSKSHRKSFVATMTAAQIAEGERLAAEWTPDSPCP